MFVPCKPNKQLAAGQESQPQPKTGKKRDGSRLAFFVISIQIPTSKLFRSSTCDQIFPSDPSTFTIFLATISFTA